MKTMLSFTILFTAALFSFSADWPEYRHDAGRSGYSSETLTFPLASDWAWQSSAAPDSIAKEPANQDFWHRLAHVEEVVTFDHAFQPIVAEGKLFFASRADRALYALDAASGKIIWRYLTTCGARLAPLYADGKIYLGTDAGMVLCVNAKTGKKIWESSLSDSKIFYPGNGQLISNLPICSGLILHDGKLFLAAGLFPNQGAEIFVLDARTGKKLKSYSKSSPEGYMTLVENKLVIPAGRANAMVLDVPTGKFNNGFLGRGANGGGEVAYFDGVLVKGSNEKKNIAIKTSKSGSFSLKGENVILGEQSLFLVGGAKLRPSEKKLTAFPKKEFLSMQIELTKLESKRDTRGSPRVKELKQELGKIVKWSVDVGRIHEMAVSQNALFLGGEDQVIALEKTTGRVLFKSAVKGRVYGLAISGGRLFAATDQGHIYCFAPKRRASAVVRGSTTQKSFNEKAGNKSLAQFLNQYSRLKKGYCILFNAHDVDLPCSIAKHTTFQTVALAKNVTTTRSQQERFIQLGIPQKRGAFLTVSDFGNVPLRHYIGTLVLDEDSLKTGALPKFPKEMFRMLSPENGMLVLKLHQTISEDVVKKHFPEDLIWSFKKEDGRLIALARRKALPGAGQWSHFFANAANTACSDEKRSDKPLGIQWFGAPGPQKMVDRHHRTVAPLYDHGILFISGSDYFFGVDAYNGTILWEKPIPDSVRLVAMKNCGNMVATRQALYVATGKECLVLDPATGKEKTILTLPSTSFKPEWGYLACLENILIGSVTREGATYRQQNRKMTTTYTHYDFTPMVCSDSLFAYDTRTGKKRWEYKKNQGVIINPAIAAANSTLYFIESTDPSTLKSDNRRVPLPKSLKSGFFMTALDLKTGKKKWKIRDETPNEFSNILYLSYSDGILLVSGSYSDKENRKMFYRFKAYDAATGKFLWKRTATDPGILRGSHGEQDQHPTIVNGKIHIMQGTYSLKTGEPEKELAQGNRGWRTGGHGCGTIATSDSYAYYRGATLCRYNLETGKSETLLATLRPGCFINAIPAGGLVLMPEGSSGCTCLFALQLSIALTPINDDEK